MSSDLTSAESRFVLALCSAGPLGSTPTGLAKALGLSTSTIVNLSVSCERKGFCSRERYGMRIYLRPTSAALTYRDNQALQAGAPGRAKSDFKVRRPRPPGG
jgi:DNA-binding MarR family transcriptional regulator